MSLDAAVDALQEEDSFLGGGELTIDQIHNLSSAWGPGGCGGAGAAACKRAGPTRRRLPSRPRVCIGPPAAAAPSPALLPSHRSRAPARRHAQLPLHL